MTSIKTLISIALAGSLGMASTAYALETERQLNLDADNLELLFIDAGAGSLDVKGQAGLDSIKVEANITVDGVDDDEADEWFAENMKLSLTKDGGKATLKAVFEEDSGFSWGWNNERTIDLVVKIPASLNLKVDDGSGWSKVSNLESDLNFDDGSGSLEVSNIQGNVIIDDGSGEMIIHTIGGDLSIDDGSGSLEIDKVTGKVNIEDGSGSIKITNIDKSVYINDGSGSVYACDLQANLTVDDGSGNVDTCNVKGEVVIK